VHPTANFVYASNVEAGTVTAFSLLPGGGISPIADFAAGAHPYEIGFDPPGAFAFVPNRVDSTISAFSVDKTTGMLAPVAGSPFAAGAAGPTGIVIVPKP